MRSIVGRYCANSDDKSCGGLYTYDGQTTCLPFFPFLVDFPSLAELSCTQESSSSSSSPITNFSPGVITVPGTERSSCFLSCPINTPDQKLSGHVNHNWLNGLIADFEAATVAGSLSSSNTIIAVHEKISCFIIRNVSPGHFYFGKKKTNMSSAVGLLFA